MVAVLGNIFLAIFFKIWLSYSIPLLIDLAFLFQQYKSPIIVFSALQSGTRYAVLVYNKVGFCAYF